jgi:DNA invertase Pin-like site-specific DNA recombinase
MPPSNPSRSRPAQLRAPGRAIGNHGRLGAGTGLLLGYVRVSRGADQTNAMRVKSLSSAGCRRIFEEVSPGGRWDRPELHRLLADLRMGDTVVVLTLDQLSRSFKEVLAIMVRITAAGAGFRSIVEGIDTTTPAGRMMMRMVGAFDQFERATISERRAAGLASARAEGHVLGRPRKLNPGKEREIAESVLSGRKSGIAMAKQYGINRGTVSRIVAEYRDGLSKQNPVTDGPALSPVVAQRSNTP